MGNARFVTGAGQRRAGVSRPDGHPGHVVRVSPEAPDAGDEMVAAIGTARLLLRQWSEDDAAAALSIYGTDAVSRWSKPWARQVGDADEMRSLIRRWLVEDASAEAPAGHWALADRRDGSLVGGLSLAYIPTQGETLTIRWELAPTQWGNGYAAEAADALVHWAMHEAGIVEVFALVHPDNARAAATAERVGMELVRDLGSRLHVYRARDGELGSPEPLDWPGGRPLED